MSSSAEENVPPAQGMSIRTAAYRLCKSVMNSLLRDNVAAVIVGFNFQRPGESRGSFGLYARNMRLQFFGYLMIDQNRSNIREDGPPSPIPGFSDDERKLLASVHREIVQLNQRCVASLVTALPQCALAVDPYNKYIYNETPTDPEVSLFEPDAADAIVKSFRNHPAIAIALESSNQLGEALTGDHYISDVVQLSEHLINMGALNSPDEYYQYRRSRPSPQTIHFRHISALMCVRDSLANLNQLIFQAAVMDRLIFIGDDHIIDVGKRVPHATSLGVTLLCQQVRRSILEYLMMDVGAIVLLQGSVLRKPDNLPFRVEFMSEQSSREFGETMQLELRGIDEHLNSFPFLLR